MVSENSAAVKEEKLSLKTVNCQIKCNTQRDFVQINLNCLVSVCFALVFPALYCADHIFHIGGRNNEHNVIYLVAEKLYIFFIRQYIYRGYLCRKSRSAYPFDQFLEHDVDDAYSAYRRFGCFRIIGIRVCKD